MTCTGLKPSIAPCALHKHFAYGHSVEVLLCSRFTLGLSLSSTQENGSVQLIRFASFIWENIDLKRSFIFCFSLFVLQKRWPCLLAMLTWANLLRTSSTKAMVWILGKVV